MQEMSQATSSIPVSEEVQLHETSASAASKSSFNPRNNYAEMDIASLVSGLGCVTVTGRIANLHELSTPGKLEAAAKGAFKLTIKDDTGAFTVKLWFADTIYELRLGMLVSIWTPHIHSQRLPNSSVLDLTTSIFPERDNTCNFLIHQKQITIMCRVPLGHKDGKDLSGLMTLKRFMEGGHQNPGARILACVKSVGGKKKVTPKDKEKEPFFTIDVALFDETEELVLSLTNCAITSTSLWQANETVLLITDANCKKGKKKEFYLSMRAETMVDVDPLMRDAFMLREFAQKVKKRECVNLAYPDDVFDVQTAEESEEQILFTLADIDQWARANPSQQFIGWLNLTVIEMNLWSLYKRNMLLCEECCGLPVYANSTKVECRNCKAGVTLRLNPKIVGLLIDETGGITSGKAIWSESAWWQLLGRTPEELITSDSDVIQYLQHRILFLRITVMFGWCNDVGRLVILKMVTL